MLGAVAAGFVLSTATIASAQTTAKNTLYVEGGGPGGPWSFNYERLIGAFNLRAGVGHFGASDSRMTTFPLGLNFIGIGGTHNHLELGGGATIAVIEGDTYLGDSTGAFGWGIVGYRHQPPNSGFNFRVGAMPIVGEFGFLPYGYISFGATF